MLTVLTIISWIVSIYGFTMALYYRETGKFLRTLKDSYDLYPPYARTINFTDYTPEQALEVYTAARKIQTLLNSLTLPTFPFPPIPQIAEDQQKLAKIFKEIQESTRAICTATLGKLPR